MEMVELILFLLAGLWLIARLISLIIEINKKTYASLPIESELSKRARWVAQLKGEAHHGCPPGLPSLQPCRCGPGFPERETLPPW
jgi:hypothetical protein